VWLVVQGRLVLAASWPPEAPPPDTEPPEPAPGARDHTGVGRRALPVRHGGRVYGAFRLQERYLLPLTSTEERLFADLAAQAGLVLRLVGLRADLSAQHRELTVRTDELRLSRERLIQAQDAERRKLERDIHDGAQQHLVALAVNLRLAESLAATDPGRAAQLLGAQADAARAAIGTLSRLAAGMYPCQLVDDGVGAALSSELGAAPVPVSVVDGLQQRLPDQVEAALYFFAMEAVQNAAKHAGASSIVIELTDGADAPRVTVTDNGVGFAVAKTSGGAGLSNMRDRIDAIGGVVSIASGIGEGTTVTAVVPAQRRPT
jgi:signal transduction histidine kinase